MLTNEEFLQRLKDKNVPYIPLEEYKGYDKKIKWLCYKNKKHIFESSPSCILNGCGCPFCAHQKVFVGETDMWTTNPEMASMLLNSDDGYKYMANSIINLHWKCPDCGNILFKSPNTVFRQGLLCGLCGDGVSYPEKYVMHFLRQLDVKYMHDTTTSWSNGRRYDFYVESQNLIIETHGLQHYEERFNNFDNKRKNRRSLAEEIENDKYKKQLALSNGIEYYIELDCRESNGKFIKNSIYNSPLFEIFDLSNIDWKQCELSSTKSLIFQVTNAWNDGIYDIQRLSKMFGLDRSTIRDYLKKGTDIGLCIYDINFSIQEGVKKSATKKWKSVRCIETGKIYTPIKSAEMDGYCAKHISAVCRGDRETTGGCHWEYV